MQWAFLAALLNWAQRQAGASRIALPVTRADPSELLHAIVVLKCVFGDELSSTLESMMSDKAEKIELLEQPRAEMVPATEASIPPEMVEALDDDEAEFRPRWSRSSTKKRGSFARCGVTSTASRARARPASSPFQSARRRGKTNSFARIPSFDRSFRSSTLSSGWTSTIFAVTPDMVAALAGIGITVTDHVLYLTVHIARRNPHRAGATGRWRRRAE